MSVDQLKTEAVKLARLDRFALAQWIEQNQDVQDVRRESLIREIRGGLDELERGEYVECANDEELHAFFDAVKERGRKLRAAQDDATT